MKDSNLIPINIWDDYYEDGYVPDGEKQETYAYVEDDKIPHEDRLLYLALVHKYMVENLNLPDVRVNLIFNDTALKYPQLVGTDMEYILFKRHELRIENLTHERREQLVEELRAANLSYNNKKFKIYSES